MQNLIIEELKKRITAQHRQWVFDAETLNVFRLGGMKAKRGIQSAAVVVEETEVQILVFENCSLAYEIKLSFDVPKSVLLTTLAGIAYAVGEFNSKA